MSVYMRIPKYLNFFDVVTMGVERIWMTYRGGDWCMVVAVRGMVLVIMVWRDGRCSEGRMVW